MASMGSKIYVGNLRWSTDESSLRDAFGQWNVLEAVVMREQDTNRSRGFGFVTLASPEEAETAIRTMNEQELDGRRIKVNVANQRQNSGGFGGQAQASFYQAAGYQRPQGYGQPGYAQGFDTSIYDGIGAAPQAYMPNRAQTYGGQGNFEGGNFGGQPNYPTGQPSYSGQNPPQNFASYGAGYPSNQQLNYYSGQQQPGAESSQGQGGVRYS